MVKHVAGSRRGKNPKATSRAQAGAPRLKEVNDGAGQRGEAMDTDMSDDRKTKAKAKMKVSRSIVRKKRKVKVAGAKRKEKRKGIASARKKSSKRSVSG